MFKLISAHIDTEKINDLDKFCGAIKDLGGPDVSCTQNEDSMTIEINECHLIEAAQMEPYVCEITQGWVEAMLTSICGDSFVVERTHTIVSGAKSCIFECKPNYQTVPNAASAIQRIKNLQEKISDKLILILEFDDVSEFNQFSLVLNDAFNAEIRNVTVNDGKYVAEVIVFRQGLSRIS